MELRVVQEFLKAGVALQTVRVAWGHARRVFQTRHPFADQRLFVAKGQVFAAVDTTRGSTPDLLEISSRTQPWQTVAGPILAQTVKAVEFDEQSRRVRRWWPLGPSQPIVLDPTIAFGAPVVQRTRVRTTILAHHAAHIPVAQLARAYELSTADVEAAVNFEVQLAA
jgi:uncharacterized protein (DUF433 family)